MPVKALGNPAYPINVHDLFLVLKNILKHLVFLIVMIYPGALFVRFGAE